MTKYDDMSADWQEGYDDFYYWESDTNEDENGYEPGECDPVEYDKGWAHANYENAYESYQLARGGPTA